VLVRDAICDTHIGQVSVERQFWQIVLADHQLRELEGLDDPEGTSLSLSFWPIVTGSAVTEPAQAKTADSSRFRDNYRSRPPEQPVADQRSPPYNLSLDLSIPPLHGHGPLPKGPMPPVCLFSEVQRPVLLPGSE
jgi:hypothetical protein